MCDIAEVAGECVRENAEGCSSLAFDRSGKSKWGKYIIKVKGYLAPPTDRPTDGPTEQAANQPTAADQVGQTLGPTQNSFPLETFSSNFNAIYCIIHPHHHHHHTKCL